ncbi:DUF6988 family protein [Pseudomonas sp. LT1P18]|jgi:hypothetical protein|uniref:DUF6988 family protein n=1 Tax=Pseudomonas arabinosi TaxID=3398357 RepID=UPI0039EF800F
MDLIDLLMRSSLYDERINEFFSFEPLGSARRFETARRLCSLSFEHSRGVKSLVAAGLCSSAAALMRVQYESLVRAMWSLYGASNEQVDELLAELTPSSGRRASRASVSINSMLNAVQEKAPHAPVKSLREFKDSSWYPLNSFVHGGIHAVIRHGEGFPVDLAIMMVRLSNALLGISGDLIRIMAGIRPEEGRMAGLQREFSDCLPESVAG